MRPAIRLPLQIGTTSLWSMTRGALLLVPGILVTPIGLVSGAALAWYGGGETSLAIGAFLVVTPVMFVLFALAQLGGMLRARPSDAVLDAEGLRIEGGPHGGVHVPWAQIDPERCSLTDEKDRRMTAADIVAANWSESDRTGAGLTYLAVEVAGKKLVIAEAEAPEERASLAALYDSIHAGAWRGAPDEPAEVSAEVVRCPSCGAAVVPDTATHVACHRCGGRVEVPPQVCARVRDAEQGREARARAAGLVTKLIDQPGATRTNLLFVLGGAAMLLAWPASLVIGAWAYWHRDLDAARVLSLLVFPLALIPGLYALLRTTLVDRFALRLLTLDLGAREPARAGDPYGCHACGGPLVVLRDEVVVRCVYCDADNVLGLDLRQKTRRERSAATSLAKALEWRASERRRWRWWIVPALALTAVGGALLWRAVRPHPRTHALAAVGGALERVTSYPPDERAPMPAGDGERLALVEGAEDPQVVIVARSGERRQVGAGTSPAWDGDGTPLVLRVGLVTRVAEGDERFLLPSFGRDVTRVSGRGTLAVSLATGVVGISTTAALGGSNADGGHMRAGTLGSDASVSADGRRLAFVRAVDEVPQVFSTAVDSPGWRQWTTDAAPKGQPTWSPDGRRLVWTVDAGDAAAPRRNLWIGADDGSTPRALTEGDADACDPAWGDDGWVYFAAHAFGRYDIFRVDPEEVAPGPAVADTPALHPGPAALAVERVSDDALNEYDPVLAPDGRTLAYAQTRSYEGDILSMQVVLRTLATGEERVLRQFDRSASSLQWARSPAWTPDGALVFVLAEEVASLQRVDPAKSTNLGAEVLLGPVPRGVGLARPVVAPDGGAILVERRPVKDQPWELLLRAADGTITPLGVGTNAVWRADGQAFAFVRAEAGRGRVWLATTADPTHPTPVDLGDHDVRGVAWHPDGQRWIVAGARGPAKVALLVVEASGAWQPLIAEEGDFGRPSVGADGWVYFNSDATGQFDVWRVRPR